MEWIETGDVRLLVFFLDNNFYKFPHLSHLSHLRFVGNCHRGNTSPSGLPADGHVIYPRTIYPQRLLRERSGRPAPAELCLSAAEATARIEARPRSSSGRAAWATRRERQTSNDTSAEVVLVVAQQRSSTLGQSSTISWRAAARRRSEGRGAATAASSARPTSAAP